MEWTLDLEKPKDNLRALLKLQADLSGADALSGFPGKVWGWVPGKGNTPMISPHLKALRPFLQTGDFAPGSWGHSMVDELQPADLTVEKVAYSAFYMTRMEWVLRKAGITNILVAGIVSNGGVASTVRDAHVRDFSTTVLSDGCAAHDSDVHNRAIADLSTVAQLSTCAEALVNLTGAV